MTDIKRRNFIRSAGVAVGAAARAREIARG